jgi:O-antigen/teichoic acid export membrane protein
MDPLHHAELAEAGGVMEPLQVGQGHVDRRGSSWLTVLGFGFLTLNTGMAIYRSGDDFSSIAFFGFSYVNLVLLFCYLRWYERERENPRRDFIKVAVWLLTTLLTALFFYKVAAVMPLPMAVLVWGMAVATALGFYVFFIH